MSKLNDNYKLVNEGRMAKSEFLRQARQSLPGYINQFTSYDDAIQIFKNKGILSESIEYQCPGDKFPLDEIEKGLRFELEEMGVFMTTPTPDEYKKAKMKAIDNLGKDPLYYIKKEACCCDKCKKTQEKAEQTKGKDYKQKKAEGEMKEVKPGQRKVALNEAKENAADAENAQKLFNALMGARAKKTRGRWMAKDANSVLAQVRTKFGLKSFVPKGVPPSLKFDAKNQRFDDVWAREGAATTADKAKNVGVPGLREGKATKNSKILKEAITKEVIKILSEAATANLAQLSDENASIQGIPTILNSLENIVTEIESFILKENEKIQGVFDTIGNIKNEDNIPVGYKFVQPIMQAFVKDLEPVLAKISLDNIKLPEAPEPDETEIVEPGLDQENSEIAPEEKATMFAPKGEKPNPLA